LERRKLNERREAGLDIVSRGLGVACYAPAVAASLTTATTNTQLLLLLLASVEQL